MPSTKPTLADLTLNNPYKFSAARNVPYNTVANTWTRLPYDTEAFDTNSNFDLSTNPGRYTVPVSGFYLFSWGISLPATSTDNVAALWKNGAAIAWGTELTVQGLACSNGAALIQATAGDYFEAQYYCTIVGAISTSASRTYFSGILMSLT